MDPDVHGGALRTDSPTVSRVAVMCLLQLAAAMRDQEWEVSAGDVTAAFLNGDPLDRLLYLRQPKHGLPGLHPAKLIKIEKGVFGLIGSPRKWWRKLKGNIQEHIVQLREKKLAKFIPSPLDLCVFQLMACTEEKILIEGEKLLAYAAVHVDDILLVSPKTLTATLQTDLATRFPIEEWETGNFDFIGSHIEALPDGIKISQSSYVTNRLFQIEIDSHVGDEEAASPEQVADNRSLIGALSWLASQTRPDLACGASMAQQLQSAPSVGDLRFTNQLARWALQCKDEGIMLRRIDLSNLFVVVYHDAGWANAPDDAADPVYFLRLEDEEKGHIKTGPWSLAEKKAKRRNSRVASQLGMLVVFTEKKAAQGSSAPSSILEWKSHASDRVCRSTFGAETMAALEGIELGQYVRAMFTSLDTRKLHRKVGTGIPLLALTDCRSLYDHLNKDGLPRTPTDCRLAVDVACLRQALKEEKHTADEDGRFPLSWVPTTVQRADLLTKPMKAEA